MTTTWYIASVGNYLTDEGIDKAVIYYNECKHPFVRRSRTLILLSREPIQPGQRSFILEDGEVVQNAE